jgi:plastocyanin
VEETNMRKLLIAVVAMVALSSAACSSDDGGGASSPNAAETGATGSTGAACTADNAVDLTGDDPFTIMIKDFAYNPSCFAAASASSITITNEDAVTHTFTIDGSPVDVSIPAGETFNGDSAGLDPGTYQIHCTIHPTITGTVIVS